MWLSKFLKNFLQQNNHILLFCAVGIFLNFDIFYKLASFVFIVLQKIMQIPNKLSISILAQFENLKFQKLIFINLLNKLVCVIFLFETIVFGVTFVLFVGAIHACVQKKIIIVINIRVIGCFDF